MKSISVISIHPGSGQTTVLVNLASGLVRQGFRVLIGEMGLSPRLRDWLGVAPDFGRAVNSSLNIDELQISICSSTIGGDLLIVAKSVTDCQRTDSLQMVLEQMGYDYLLLHPSDDKVCQYLSHISDHVAVCTDLRGDNELLQLQDLQENLQAARGKSQGISLIIPNRIDTREWDHNSRQLMTLGDYFGFDKIADPIPT